MLVAVAFFAACGGSDHRPHPRFIREPGIEAVNASHLKVAFRWFPKESENSRGYAVVAPCTRRFVPIPEGMYSVIVTLPSHVVRLGWAVEKGTPCCLVIRRDGSVREILGGGQQQLCS